MKNRLSKTEKRDTPTHQKSNTTIEMENNQTERQR